MKLAKLRLSNGNVRVALLNGENARLLDLSQSDGISTLSDLLHQDDVVATVNNLAAASTETVALSDATLLAPVDRQEVWAAGVTYKRSQVARMEESETGASHYDQVYLADRPELFFKSLPEKVSHPGEPVRVRADSSWTVPEPEFTLVISPAGKLVGYTIGNDMSARDIEGENPLYLPQAKVYDQCCSVGPYVLVAEGQLDRPNTKIILTISRGGETVIEDETNLGEMARGFEDLIGWLFRDATYPNGAMMLTGTGIVPPDEFTLENGDVVAIEVTGIGTLRNPVLKGR